MRPLILWPPPSHPVAPFRFDTFAKSMRSDRLRRVSGTTGICNLIFAVTWGWFPSFFALEGEWRGGWSGTHNVALNNGILSLARAAFLSPAANKAARHGLSVKLGRYRPESLQ
jgi:hypothetical protein